MKNFAMKSLLVTAICAAGVVASAQSATVSFSPNKDRYARGEVMTVVVVARNSAGQRVPGAWVEVREWVSSLGQYKSYWCGYANSSGELRVPYRVPTNTSWDNVYIDGWTYTNGWGFGTKRVPIGR